MPEAIKAFFDSEAGQLAIWVIVLPLLDFALGVAAAIRDQTLELDVVAAFLRTHIMGRVIPIWLLLFAGYFADNIVIPVANVPALLSIGVAAAGLYVVETAGSILRSWGPQSGPRLLTRDPQQPVPEG